jgi:hypothetical protein
VLQGLAEAAAALPGGREALWSGPLGGSGIAEGGEEAIEQGGAAGALVGFWSCLFESVGYCGSGLGLWRGGRLLELWRAGRLLGLCSRSLGSGAAISWALEAPWLLCLLLISRATSGLAPLLFPVFFFLSFRSLF